MEQYIIQYSPFVLMLFMFLMQFRVFVTPEQLEKKHREILKSMQQDFVSKSNMAELDKRLSSIENKTDMILTHILRDKEH